MCFLVFMSFPPKNETYFVSMCFLQGLPSIEDSSEEELRQESDSVLQRSETPPRSVPSVEKFKERSRKEEDEEDEGGGEEEEENEEEEEAEELQSESSERSGIVGASAKDSSYDMSDDRFRSEAGDSQLLSAKG